MRMEMFGLNLQKLRALIKVIVFNCILAIIASRLQVGTLTLKG